MAAMEECESGESVTNERSVIEKFCAITGKYIFYNNDDMFSVLLICTCHTLHNDIPYVGLNIAVNNTASTVTTTGS